MKSLIALVLTALIFGCASGTKTPTARQSLTTLIRAYERNDPGLFLSVLSDESLERIKLNAEIFHELDEARRAETIKAAGLDFDPAQELSVEQYVTLYFAAIRKNGDDPLAKALGARITEIDEGENTAIFTMGNSIELCFRLVEGEWKFDYTILYE